MHPQLALLEQLLQIPSPSGYEQQMAATVVALLAERGYAAETDPAGNVFVRLAGVDPTLPLHCYAAHMDEIGLAVTAIEADGMLRARRSGGLHPWKLGEAVVDLLGDEATVQAVVSMGSTHRDNAADTAVRWSDVRLLTGLSVPELLAAGVRPGTPGVPVAALRGPHVIGNATDPLVAAWTFDDRLGMVVLLTLLERLQQAGTQPAAPTLIAFTTGEEIGGLGAKTLTQRERPEVFVSVDGSPIPPETTLTLDGRPCAWARDRLATYDRALLRQLARAAREAGTELQTAAYLSAASDASLVNYSGLVPRIACFGHVRENSHGYEVIRLSVIDNVINTLAVFMQMAGT